jgi:Family of unknown function (DUF6600)
MPPRPEPPPSRSRCSLDRCYRGSATDCDFLKAPVLRIEFDFSSLMRSNDERNVRSGPEGPNPSDSRSKRRCSKSLSDRHSSRWSDSGLLAPVALHLPAPARPAGGGRQGRNVLTGLPAENVFFNNRVKGSRTSTRLPDDWHVSFCPLMASKVYRPVLGMEATMRQIMRQWTREGTVVIAGFLWTLLVGIGGGGGGVPPAFGGGSEWDITEAEGDLFVLPADQVDWRMTASSDLLGEGDRLWAAPTGRAAVSGPEGLVVRLDHQTQIEVIRPSGRPSGRPSEPYGSRLTLSLLSGALYLKHPDLGREGMEFDLQIGRTTLRSEEPTMARVETLDDGVLAVAVYKGEVQIVTEKGSTWIGAGEMTEVTPTAVVWMPESIRFAQRDDFDRWNKEQELRLARREPSPDGSEPDLARLDGYGEWMQTATYGRVWQPRVAIDWQPYLYGQWVWVSFVGWSWVSAEPWGWLPSHYGQWVWDSPYGWVWTPGYTWAPAWVLWTPYQGGWAWAPYGPFVTSISISWRYWCWTGDMGQAGWRYYRPIGEVAPPTRVHRVGNRQQQPPHRSDGNRRARSEEAAHAGPIPFERTSTRLRSDGHGGTLSVARQDGRVTVPQTPSVREGSGRRDEPGEIVHQDIDRGSGQDSGRASRERSDRREGSGQGTRQELGQFRNQGSEHATREGTEHTAQIREEQRHTEPGSDLSMDRQSRAGRQEPTRLNESSPRAGGLPPSVGTQPGRRTQATNIPAVRDVPDGTVSRPAGPVSPSSNSVHRAQGTQTVDRPVSNTDGRTSGGFSGRGHAAGDARSD